MRKLAVILALIAAALLLGCAEEQVTPTPTPTPTPEPIKPVSEETEVAQIENTINEIETILNDLQELDNISFDV
ncbi:hypothetical protein [Archaeoglobus veneficus]|uniref:Uncharacterized protein n=1 Tax=Archaeoglobus veneficus (strain DSM 11195 / SNP6) TaxID=693661 RepID=F2KQ06_ARCVS|nr:hypothetical protein [Archaeoglobus veneficus]AEA47609.1 hypothetical protein Arcve_1609 [Archaeoglobus veneficus SNP6]